MNESTAEPSDQMPDTVYALKVYGRGTNDMHESTHLDMASVAATLAELQLGDHDEVRITKKVDHARREARLRIAAVRRLCVLAEQYPALASLLTRAMYRFNCPISHGEDHAAIIAAVREAAAKSGIAVSNRRSKGHAGVSLDMGAFTVEVYDSVGDFDAELLAELGPEPGVTE